MEQTIESASIHRGEISEPLIANETRASGVSWAAVIGGAFVSAALSLVLLALGAGFGFSSVSIWSNAGASASTIGIAAIVWIIVMQIVSSSMGGYLAGRLRTKWVHVHTDEVYFRDTAHGFLAWAVASVITAAFLASAATALTGSAATSSPARESMATPGNSGQAFDLNNYFVDMLFRSPNPQPEANTAAVRSEGSRIFANALLKKEFPPADRSYLTQLVKASTGLSQTEAGQRVSEVFASAQQAAETARKTMAHSLLWAFIALLIGAFCASYGATIGGRQRDHVVTI